MFWVCMCFMVLCFLGSLESRFDGLSGFPVGVVAGLGFSV